MKKIKLELVQREFIKKSFAGQEIKIKPYIDIDEVCGLINVILNNAVNGEEPISIVEKASCILQLDRYVIDTCSNVEIGDIDFDLFTTSGLTEYVTKFVVNYPMAKQMLLNDIVQHNLTMTMLSMFNSLPDMEELSSHTELLGETLKNVPDLKLKLITDSMTNQLATKSERTEKIDKQIKKDKANNLKN